MYISDLISYTVGCHTNDVKRIVKWLLREGYAHRTKMIYRVNQNSCHRELQFVGDANKTLHQPNDVFIDIIRLTYIPNLKLKDAQLRTGGNLAI
jgi:hypothetical protein